MSDLQHDRLAWMGQTRLNGDNIPLVKFGREWNHVHVTYIVLIKPLD